MSVPLLIWYFPPTHNIIYLPALLVFACKYTNTQIHKYTNTQIHKYTNTQMHKYTNTQIHKIYKYTNKCQKKYTKYTKYTKHTKIHKYASTQIHTNKGQKEKPPYVSKVLKILVVGPVRFLSQANEQFKR